LNAAVRVDGRVPTAKPSSANTAFVARPVCAVAGLARLLGDRLRRRIDVEENFVPRLRIGQIQLRELLDRVGRELDRTHSVAFLEASGFDQVDDLRESVIALRLYTMRPLKITQEW